MITVTRNTQPVASCDHCGEATHRERRAVARDGQPLYEPTQVSLWDVTLAKDLEGYRVAVTHMATLCPPCLGELHVALDEHHKEFVGGVR